MALPFAHFPAVLRRHPPHPSWRCAQSTVDRTLPTVYQRQLLIVSHDVAHVQIIMRRNQRRWVIQVATIDLAAAIGKLGWRFEGTYVSLSEQQPRANTYFRLVCHGPWDVTANVVMERMCSRVYCGLPSIFSSTRYPSDVEVSKYRRTFGTGIDVCDRTKFSARASIDGSSESLRLPTASWHRTKPLQKVIYETEKQHREGVELFLVCSCRHSSIAKARAEMDTINMTGDTCTHLWQCRLQY